MFAVFHITDGRQPWILLTGFHSIFIICHVYCSVVVTSPKHTLMATLIGEVHSNLGSRNFGCRLLRIFIAQNINIVYQKYNTGGLSIMGLVRHFRVRNEKHHISSSCTL